MDEPQPPAAPSPQKQRSTGLLTAIIICVLLTGVLAWQTWQLKQTQAQVATDQGTIAQLQGKADELTRQLAAAKKTPASSAPATTTPAPAVPMQATNESIANAVKNKDYASLQSLMASSVNVVVAGSEKSGYESPAQAVSDLSYLDRGTAPWNFIVPAAALSTWKAGFYKNYFTGTVDVGEAANTVVVSFGFDSAGKINVVFMAASADLLM